MSVSIKDLIEESLNHRAVNHPYLRALGNGDLPDTDWALRDFADHYYGYSLHFPRYLTTVISKLEIAAHRNSLLQNLTEESGIYDDEEYAELAAVGVEREWIEGVPHPQLFRRFREATGITAPYSPDREAIELICWRESFLTTLTYGSAAEALGALGLGTENIVSTIYIPFVKALSRTDLKPRDTVFFPLHTAVDDHHQEALEEISLYFAAAPTGKGDLRRGMIKALSLRSSFWDWMYERALTCVDTPEMALTSCSICDWMPDPLAPDAFPFEENEMNLELLNLIQNIEDRKPLATAHDVSEFQADPVNNHREIYRNRNDKLGIDFSVDVLDFPGTQAFDARVVRIAAGCNNELHKHAHESLFYVISGEAEVRIGDATTTLKPGGLAFVPRWVFHQSKNTSANDELVILAITDFGLTKAVLGDYDKRTRLAANGADAIEFVE